MKRITCIVIISLLLSVFLPVTANAADTAVTTEAELISALGEGGTVVLGADIALSGFTEVLKDTVIDFKGHVISVAEGSYSANILSRMECAVVLRDSVGGGGMSDEKYYIDFSLENGSLTVESGDFDNISIMGGSLALSGGKVDNVTLGGAIAQANAVINSGASVDEWRFSSGATVNLDPSKYLSLGYKTVDNGDGTYTVVNDTVQKTGETITVYYDVYVEAFGGYHITRDITTPPEKIDLQIFHVNNGENETVEMTRISDDGKIWKAQVDKAYIGGEISFANADEGISTTILTLPAEDHLTYNHDRGWNRESNSEYEVPVEKDPSEESQNNDTDDKDGKDKDSDADAPKEENNGLPSFLIWVIPAALCVIIAAVVAVLLVRKKKK